MKTFKLLSILISLWLFAVLVMSQNNAVVPLRIPEQEAGKQTEKLQQELNLTPEQAKKVYEINLKYARERQVSNSRSAAMQRMKNKNADMEQVLNQEQNNRLQTKRYPHSSYENPGLNQNQSPANSSGSRSSSDYRTNPNVRVPSSKDGNLRNNYRTTAPDYQSGTPRNQTLRRGTAPSVRTPQFQNNQQPSRSPGSSPRRSEPAVSPQNNNSPSRSQPSRPAPTPRRTETPSNSNRR